MQLIEIGPAALSARLGAGEGFNADRAGAVKRPCRGQDCPEAVFSFVLNKRLLRPPPFSPFLSLGGQGYAEGLGNDECVSSCPNEGR